MNMIHDPLISVIVPIYNVEQYLDKCINSILNQTYHNLEIILVDDGSPDNCGSICDQYSVMDQRVKVIHKQNGGLSDARNAGLDMANGDFIAFVDSDDTIMPEMMEKLYERIVVDRSDMALCGCKRVNKKGEILLEFFLPDNVLTGFGALEASYEYNGFLFLLTWNKLYKKHLFQHIRFPVGKYHEDEYTTYLIIDQCSRVSIIKQAFYVYLYQRDDSIMQEIYSVRRLNGIEASYERYIYYKKKGGKYKELLIPEGNTFTPIFFRSKMLFRPKTQEEKKRVREIDKMARDICFNNFHQWTLPRKIKLLAPGLFVFLSKTKKIITSKK